MAQKNIGGNRKIRGIGGSMSMSKHRKSVGRAGKSPKLLHAIKRIAESNVIKDRSGIHNPAKSIRELLGGR